MLANPKKHVSPPKQRTESPEPASSVLGAADPRDIVCSCVTFERYRCDLVRFFLCLYLSFRFITFSFFFHRAPGLFNNTGNGHGEKTDRPRSQRIEADMENVGDGTDVAKGDLEKGRSHNKDVSGSGETSWDEAFLVTFGQNDAQNPFNWTKKRKWGVTAAVSGTGFIRIMVSTV